MFDSLNWDYIVKFLNITLIDLALSGDNAIVIGMAAASLPRAKRKWAIIIGGAGAVGLRILLTTVATLLMLIPLLKAIGGLVLIWVAYKLLKLDTGEAEGGEEQKSKEARNFRQAITFILAADFMMSLDNVLAVAGAADGSVALLIAGLLISMPLLMTSGGFISKLIDRFKWVVYLGALAITFTASKMVLEDGFVEARFPQPHWLVIMVSIIAAIAITGFFVLLNRLKKRALLSRPLPVSQEIKRGE